MALDSLQTNKLLTCLFWASPIQCTQKLYEVTEQVWYKYYTYNCIKVSIET